jgi:hypothetical protein
MQSKEGRNGARCIEKKQEQIEMQKDEARTD